MITNTYSNALIKYSSFLSQYSLLQGGTQLIQILQENPGKSVLDVIRAQGVTEQYIPASLGAMATAFRIPNIQPSESIVGRCNKEGVTLVADSLGALPLKSEIYGSTDCLWYATYQPTIVEQDVRNIMGWGTLPIWWVVVTPDEFHALYTKLRKLQNN